MSGAGADTPVEEEESLSSQVGDGNNDPDDQHLMALGGTATCLFDIDELEGIDEGTDLETFLKEVPPGRTNAHRGYKCNRLLKVLKAHDLIPVAAPASFGGLNASGQREFWKEVREIRRQDSPLVFKEVCDAAINRKEPAVEATVADSGNVAVSRFALLCHTMVDARAHPTWVKFHTKVAGPEREPLLMEGLLEWTRFVAGEVTNLLKRNHPQVTSIHSNLGSFPTTLELDATVTEAKSKFDTLFYKLDKSGRQEPTLLGTPEQNKIVAMCTGNAVQLRSEDFDAAFNAEVKMKVEAAGKIFQKPHEKTLCTFEKKHNIETKAAETSTDARL
ncbi:hypothetical protein B484DRAFT_404158, partial [Ochromonadaceae sp. CCMP2298]